MVTLPVMLLVLFMVILLVLSDGNTTSDIMSAFPGDIVGASYDTTTSDVMSAFPGDIVGAF